MSPVKAQTVGEYLAALGSTAAVPGGGSAAALSAAMGAALVSMVAKLSARKAASAPERAAQLGSCAASYVVQQMGARLPGNLQETVQAILGTGGR